MYKEFFETYRLSASVDQIFVMRIPTGNKQQLLLEMLLDDLLATQPSRNAQAILAEVPPALPLIQANNRDRLRVEVVEYSHTNPVNYDPPPELIEKYMLDPRYGASFHVPLIISNSGKKFAHVSSLVLIARLKSAPRRKWAFGALVEVDVAKLTKPGEIKVDADLMAGMFTGLAVPPGGSVRANPWFVPITDAKNQIISRSGIEPGEYELQVFGYGPRNKRVVQSRWIPFDLRKEFLIQAFLGSTGANSLTLEDHINDAVGAE